jgi:RNA polymerase sigma-70 factor (ECF subfamily)
MTAHDHTLSTPVEEALSAGRSRYLAFVRRRISDPDLAEDILQEALLRAFRAAPDIDDGERLTAWFYRVLRNAIVDAYRRRDVQNRRSERLHDRHGLPDLSREDERTLCECFRALLPALRPEYAAVLSAVDLDERPPHEVAEEFGLTTNNLNVRRHRARRALRESLEATCRICADHGCLDCTCETAPVV